MVSRTQRKRFYFDAHAIYAVALLFVVCCQTSFEELYSVSLLFCSVYSVVNLFFYLLALSPVILGLGFAPRESHDRTQPGDYNRGKRGSDHMSVYYINGEFVHADSASVSARDLAILRGYGVFDFLRTYAGVPFQLGAHLRRLLRSADLIELACPWDLEELGEIVLETLRPQRL